MNTQTEGLDLPATNAALPDVSGDWFARAAATGIGKRIKEARGANSQKRMAEAIHCHLNTWGKFERNEAVPDALQLIEIGRATGYSPAWILLGDGYEKSAPAGEGGALQPSLEAADLVLVPSYGVEASAGNGSPVSDEQVIGRFAFKRSWLERKGLDPQQLAVVTARGDSMEPTVRDGDILLIDRNIARVATDGIYLIERENELYCKRLQRKFDGGVTIMSDNARYEPQQLSSEAADVLNVTGRVIWIGGER